MKLEKRNLNLIIIIISSVVSVFLLFNATKNWGPGYSYDSIGYLSAARNTIEGLGLRIYAGDPLVLQPPLYPLFLALIALLSGKDPIVFMQFINCLFFGLTIFLTGCLSQVVFKKSTLYITGACLLCVFSVPIFFTFGWAWSEVLFIFLVLSSLYLSYQYIEHQNILYLSLFSIFVSFSILTRYIGIVLIVYGLIILLLFGRKNLKKRLTHAGIFLFVSVTPISVWFIRNLSLSNTLMGSRAPSQHSLYENILFAIRSFVDWYTYSDFGYLRLILILLLLFIFLVSLIWNKIGFKYLVQSNNALWPLLIYSGLYLFLLIFSATTTAYDRIEKRLLAPMVIPIVLFSIGVIKSILDRICEKDLLPKKVLFLMGLFFVVLWLIFPIDDLILRTKYMQNVGNGYLNKDWMESEIVAYIVENPDLQDESTLYTNGIDVAYITAGLKTKAVPGFIRHGQQDIETYLESLQGSWPQEEMSCLIWFDDLVFRHELLSFDEINHIVDLQILHKFEDGTISLIQTDN